jgi:hypothetical protein
MAVQNKALIHQCHIWKAPTGVALAVDISKNLLGAQSGELSTASATCLMEFKQRSRLVASFRVMMPKVIFI